MSLDNPQHGGVSGSSRDRATNSGDISASWRANQDPEAVRYFTPPHMLSEVYEFFSNQTESTEYVDLDPCQDPEAFVSAVMGYDIRRGEDGLLLPWSTPIACEDEHGEGESAPASAPRIRNRLPTVFCNPPYDKPAPWLQKAAEHYGSGGTALLLVNSAPGTRGWRDHVFGCPGALVCFLARRVTFYKRGVGYEGPNNRDSALIYYGDNRLRFFEQFSRLGTIVAPWRPVVSHSHSHESVKALERHRQNVKASEPLNVGTSSPV